MIDSGEKNLIVAVMERAIQDLMGDVKDIPTKERSKVRLEAERWVRSNRTGPFSFLWCADALELDPLAIRKKIKGWRFNEW